MTLWSNEQPVWRSLHVTCAGCGTSWSSARAPQLRAPGASCPRCGWPLITHSLPDTHGGERGELAQVVPGARIRYGQG